jgi:hypothetical protein
LKNAVFSNVSPRGSCKNRRFGATSRLNHQEEKNRRVRNNFSSKYQALLAAKQYYIHVVFLRSMLRLLVTAKVVPNSPILVTLMMMEATRSSETSVITRAT